MATKFVTNAEVTRREDGLVFTFRCADGEILETYLSASEAEEVLAQINAQVDGYCAGTADNG